MGWHSTIMQPKKGRKKSKPRALEPAHDTSYVGGAVAEVALYRLNARLARRCRRWRAIRSVQNRGQHYAAPRFYSARSDSCAAEVSWNESRAAGVHSGGKRCCAPISASAPARFARAALRHTLSMEMTTPFRQIFMRVK